MNKKKLQEWFRLNHIGRKEHIYCIIEGCNSSNQCLEKLRLFIKKDLNRCLSLKDLYPYLINLSLFLIIEYRIGDYFVLKGEVIRKVFPLLDNRFSVDALDSTMKNIWYSYYNPKYKTESGIYIYTLSDKSFEDYYSHYKSFDRVAKLADRYNGYFERRRMHSQMENLYCRGIGQFLERWWID